MTDTLSNYNQLLQPMTDEDRKRQRELAELAGAYLESPSPTPEECKHDYRPYPVYPWGSKQQCCICGEMRATPHPSEPLFTSPTPEEIEAAARAIENASCPGREGPFGLYDYSSYGGNSPPHVVRDFRDQRSGLGKHLFASWDAEEARKVYEKITAHFIAEAALKAAMAVRRGKL